MRQIENGDGTATAAPGDHWNLRVIPVTGEQGSEVVDPVRLAQAALARVVGGCGGWIYDGEAMVRGEKIRKGFVSPHRVTLDFPKPEQDLAEGITFSVVESDESIELVDEFGGPMIVDSGVEGWSAEILAAVSVPLEVWAICAHTDERSAARSALLSALLVEPAVEHGGRLIVGLVDVPGAHVILSFNGLSSEDGTDAQGLVNRRGLVVRVSAEVPMIRLICELPRIAPAQAVTVEP